MISKCYKNAQAEKSYISSGISIVSQIMAAVLFSLPLFYPTVSRSSHALWSPTFVHFSHIYKADDMHNEQHRLELSVVVITHSRHQYVPEVLGLICGNIGYHTQHAILMKVKALTNNTFIYCWYSNIIG